MQKSIALALLFGSASATTPGPLPVSVENFLQFTTGISNIAPADSDEAIVAKYDQVTSGGKKAGLYGCLRSGHVPMATQGFLKNSGDTTIEVVDQAATIRTFYQTTEVMQGLVARVDVSAASTPQAFDKYGVVTTTQDDVDAILAIDGSYFECCAQGNNGDTDVKVKKCPTAFDLTINADSAALNDEMANRLNFYNDQTDPNSGPFDIAAQTTIFFNEDFILGAMAQLSDEVADDDNWCSKFFMTEITDTATYSANTGFNSNTKCSWQVSAEALSAPQFAVAATTTSTENLIQWIEWSGLTTMTAGSILRPIQDGLVSVNFGVGNYPTAEGVFFNPFAQVESATMQYVQTSGGDPTVFDDTDAGFVQYSFDSNIAGSPGKAVFWQNSPNSFGYQSADQATHDLDMGIFTTVLDYAKPAYAAYDSALTTFNTDAAAYNDAVAAYNTALTDTPKELPVVMERPCPPTKPAAIAGVAIEALDTEDVETAITGLTTGIAEYVQQNDNVVKVNDAKRFGYVVSSQTYDAAASPMPAFDADTAFAGHVFGRLGQGKMNLPGNVKPWKWFTDEASIQQMMISIFPENGEAYGTTGALAEGQTIDIEISSAALSITDGFELPSASATAALALTDKDAAQALVFSAVALAAAVASLY